MARQNNYVPPQPEPQPMTLECGGPGGVRWRSAKLKDAGIQHDTDYKGGTITVAADDVPAAESAMGAQRSEVWRVNAYGLTAIAAVAAAVVVFAVPSSVLFVAVGVGVLFLVETLRNTADSSVERRVKKTGNVMFGVKVTDLTTYTALAIGFVVVIAILTMVASSKTGIPAPWQVTP